MLAAGCGPGHANPNVQLLLRNAYGPSNPYLFLPPPFRTRQAAAQESDKRQAVLEEMMPPCKCPVGRGSPPKPQCKPRTSGIRRARAVQYCTISTIMHANHAAPRCLATSVGPCRLLHHGCTVVAASGVAPTPPCPVLLGLRSAPLPPPATTSSTPDAYAQAARIHCAVLSLLRPPPEACLPALAGSMDMGVEVCSYRQSAALRPAHPAGSMAGVMLLHLACRLVWKLALSPLPWPDRGARAGGLQLRGVAGGYYGGRQMGGVIWPRALQNTTAES